MYDENYLGEARNYETQSFHNLSSARDEKKREILMQKAP